MSVNNIHPMVAAVCDAASNPMAVAMLASGRLLHINGALQTFLGRLPTRLAGPGDDALFGEAPPPGKTSASTVHSADGRARSIQVKCTEFPGRDDLVLVTLTTDSGAGLRQRLDLTYEAVHDGIWDWDLRTDELLCSEKLLSMVGLNEETFAPRIETFFDRLHPADRAAVEAAIDGHLRDHEPYDVRYRFRHEQGHFIEVHALGQASWDDDGRPLRMVGSFEDVSEHVATLEALSETDRRFRQLAENVPGAIFRYLLHPDGSDEIEYMSPGCVDIWEVDAETISGDPTVLWQMVLEEDLPAMQGSVQRSAETLNYWGHQWRVRHPRAGSSGCTGAECRRESATSR